MHRAERAMLPKAIVKMMKGAIIITFSVQWEQTQVCGGMTWIGNRPAFLWLWVLLRASCMAA